MRLLAIDYGTTKIGLALSDLAGRFAYPYQVIPTKGALEAIVAICIKEGVAKIVMGESLNYASQANPVMEEVKRFKQELAVASKLEIAFEPEFMTTLEADRVMGNDDGLRDARAAAILLKSYIDRGAHGGV